LKAMTPYFVERFGNPSSLHSTGREAREAVERSRSDVARLLGSEDSEVVFTSGGTEADNLAIQGVAGALARRGKHIITSSVEHHAVLNTCRELESRGFEVTYLPVDSAGLVDPGAVERAIGEETILISIMHANNEVGTIEPIQEIGKIANDAGICFHTDAVQSFGHIPTKVDELGVDLLSISGHKLYGPKGIGALYVRKGTEIKPLIYGGGHEGGLRSSTENVPGIVGLGAACMVASREMKRRESELLRLRTKLTRGLLNEIDEVYLNGHPEKRLPGNVNVTIRFVEGESILLGLDRVGICVSTGSACSSPEGEPSHVLRAMGIPPEDLHSSIRLTLGAENTEEDVAYTIQATKGVVAGLREMSPLYPPKS